MTDRKQLTPREFEVLQTMATIAHGGAKETARVLGTSERTVEIHAANAMRKLGARTRLEAVLMWDRQFNRTDLPPADPAAAAKFDAVFQRCEHCIGLGFVRKDAA